MLKAICHLACLCGLTFSLYGQVSTAELSGTVTDATGATVANVKVTATNAGTNIERSTNTDSTGRYIIPLLPPGDYVLTAEASGFRKSVQRGITLQINQQASIDIRLQLGQVSESVEVTAQAPLLQSEASNLGTVVTEKLVNQLPLNGRNFIQLAVLSPGVTGVGFSATGTIMSGTRPDDRRPGTEIFSNGNREGSNNFLYDGIDDNERLTLSIVLRPAVEAVREFKIQTNLYSADIGRNSGAVVDVITKSGTNQLHGSLFEFLRNSAMDARNFFSPKGTAFPVVPPEPVWRIVRRSGCAARSSTTARTRPSSSWIMKATAATRSSLLLGNVPTLKMRQGDFSEAAHDLRSADHAAESERHRLHPRSVPGQSDSGESLGSDHGEDDQRLSRCRPARHGSTTISPIWCSTRTGTRATSAWITRSRRRTISLRASRFRIPRRRSPALSRRSRFREFRSRSIWAMKVRSPARRSQPAQHAVASYVQRHQPAAGE